MGTVKGTGKRGRGVCSNCHGTGKYGKAGNCTKCQPKKAVSKALKKKTPVKKKPITKKKTPAKTSSVQVYMTTTTTTTKIMKATRGK